MPVSKRLYSSQLGSPSDLGHDVQTATENDYEGEGASIYVVRAGVNEYAKYANQRYIFYLQRGRGKKSQASVDVIYGSPEREASF